MNTNLFFLTVSLLTIFGCVGSLNAGPFSGAHTAVKPQSPVTVTIHPAKEPSSGEEIDFVVSATSQVTAQQLAIIVYPPKDMQLIRGDLSWRGPVQRGQTKALRFTGAFKQLSNQQILVNAVIQNEKGPRFSARASYVAPSTNNNARALSVPTTGGQIDTQEDGHAIQRGERTVIEYPISP